MMPALKITVVTSAYNASSYLERCLESVRSQALPCSAVQPVDLSHWVVDAGSKDGSVEILERWGAAHGRSADTPASRYTFDYLSEPDRGQCDGFNKGVRFASGEWICWLNADDELEPGTIAAFLDCLKSHGNANVVYGHTRFIDDQSRPIRMTYHIPFHPMLLFNAVYAPPSSGTFFRRSLLVEEPLDVDYHYVMDTEWFMRCHHQIRAVAVNKVMSRFRISNEGKTSGQIQTGVATEAHQEERLKMLRKYVFSKWPALNESQAQARLARYRAWSRIFYYCLKSRYLPEYARSRFFQGADQAS